MKYTVVRALLIALLTATHAAVFVESLSARAVNTEAKGAREFVRLRATLDACAASHLVVSAASDLLALSCEDKTVQLWDVASGRLSLTLRGFAKPPSLVFSRDGGRLAVLEDGKSVSVWDARTGAKHAAIRSTGRDFNGLKWSPDGRTLMTVMRDDSLKASQPRRTTHPHVPRALQEHMELQVDELHRTARQPDGKIDGRVDGREHARGGASGRVESRRARALHGGREQEV